MFRIASHRVHRSPLLVRHMITMARQKSPMPPLETVDIDMDTMDWDYVKNKKHSPLIIGDTDGKRMWRPLQHIDGFFSDLPIDSSQRGQPQWEVEKEKKVTDEYIF